MSSFAMRHVVEPRRRSSRKLFIAGDNRDEAAGSFDQATLLDEPSHPGDGVLQACGLLLAEHLAHARFVHRPR